MPDDNTRTRTFLFLSNAVARCWQHANSLEILLHDIVADFLFLGCQLVEARVHVILLPWIDADTCKVYKLFFCCYTLYRTVRRREIGYDEIDATAKIESNK